MSRLPSQSLFTVELPDHGTHSFQRVDRRVKLTQKTNNLLRGFRIGRLVSSIPFQGETPLDGKFSEEQVFRSPLLRDYHLTVFDTIDYFPFQINPSLLLVGYEIGTSVESVSRPVSTRKDTKQRGNHRKLLDTLTPLHFRPS